VRACDGTLSVGQLVAALADLLDIVGEGQRAMLFPRVRSFLADGLLEQVSAATLDDRGSLGPVAQ